MAGLFNAAVNFGKSALNQLLQSDPNVVRNVKPSDFDPVPIQDREDCMMLHGPRKVKVKKEEITFYKILSFWAVGTPPRAPRLKILQNLLHKGSLFKLNFKSEAARSRGV